MDFISQIIDEVVESVVEERWLPIVGFEKYQVSDLGRIKSFMRCKDGKIIKPTIDTNYCRVTLSDRKFYLFHRLILQAFQPTEEDLVCDHINHVKTDNRLCNLRWATISQNSRHKLKCKSSSSQYKGVSWAKKDKKWRAVCCVDGKNIHLGLFKTEEEGAKAYNDFVISKGLDFAILNEII